MGSDCAWADEFSNVQNIEMQMLQIACVYRDACAQHSQSHGYRGYRKPAVGVKQGSAIL
jgi:hypothetical protein